MPKTILKKIAAEHWKARRDGCKEWELRKEDDVRFEVGDVLVLQEVGAASHVYSGRIEIAEIIHVLRDADGIAPGYAILSTETMLVLEPDRVINGRLGGLMFDDEAPESIPRQRETDLLARCRAYSDAAEEAEMDRDKALARVDELATEASRLAGRIKDLESELEGYRKPTCTEHADGIFEFSWLP